MSRFSRIMAVTLCIVSLADLFLVRIARIVGLEHQFLIVILCGPLLLPQAYAKWRHLDRISAAITCVQWILLSQAALMPFMVAAGRSPAPLADQALAHVDSLMHFSTPAVVRFIRSFPTLIQLSQLAYASANYMIVLALVAPALAGNKRDSERFVLSGTIATILTAALFALLPAIGPWTGSAFVPDPVQADIEKSILLVKSANEFRLGTGISAIVTFPSFHVIIALVCGISLWGFKRLRPITGTITAAICISVITTGWHYATDVIGGVAVVLLSDFITGRWLLPEIHANFGSKTTSSAGTGSSGSAALFQALSPPSMTAAGIPLAASSRATFIAVASRRQVQ